MAPKGVIKVMNKEDAKKVFGKNLKRLRLARGLSQDELSKRLGYTNRSSINKIELGKNDMPRSKIVQAANILGVSPLELFKESAAEPDTAFKDNGITAIFEKLSPNGQEELKKFAEYLLQKEGDK